MVAATNTDRPLNPLRPRTQPEIDLAKTMLRPFAEAGYRIFPLAPGTKHARERGWQNKTYTAVQLIDWLKRGGNLGICLSPTQLVIDVDPRHFDAGDDPLARLVGDVGIDTARVPTVLSGRGDGGRHLYFTKPVGLAVSKALVGYRGIDIKTSGGLVVAPGSRHIETGGVYAVDPSSAPIGEAPLAPEGLLDMLQRPDKAPRVYGGGELAVEQLEQLLAVLDPREYRDYNTKWIPFAAACHDATAGDGLEVWATWAAQDETYDETALARNVRTWESFTSGRAGGATYMRVLADVARAGRPDLVRQIEPNFRFDDPQQMPDFTVGPRSLDDLDFGDGRP